jgi:hypothetical protein
MSKCSENFMVDYVRHAWATVIFLESIEYQKSMML